jgi:hypothetical protein
VFPSLARHASRPSPAKRSMAGERGRGWEGLGRVKMNEGNKFSFNIYNHYVVFRLDERQFALNLYSVERVVRAVAVTSLPKAPEIVLGVISVCP